uniref:Uncharacterized protein n=1 Tax=Schizophyllum commune (strain H4-8 / FGSC 9210) TaxID=578458 RepID=D8QER5_SCHCM
MTAVPGGRAVDWSGILLRRDAGRDSTLVDVYQGKAGLVSTRSLGPPKDSQDVIDDAQTRDQAPKSSLLSLLRWMGDSVLLLGRRATRSRLPPQSLEMTAGNEGPHSTVRKEHQAFARKLHQIEKDARTLLKGEEPTVLNLVRGIQRDKKRATILKKKLISLSDAIAQARKLRETGPWAPTAAIQGAMFFLFDCLKASDPESKWYALQEIARPRYVINIVGLDIPTHDATLRAADRDRVPRRANEDLDMLLMQQPQLPADYVAVEAKRCGLGEVKLSGCAPATPAQRSHPGQKAHRNDKNKGATKRKRAAKLALQQRKVATDSNSDEAEVEEPEPARKRTRSQTKAAASTSKGKGRAKAGPSSARGRRGRKAATPSDVEEEEEAEERSQPESEERDVVPPVRFRVDWDRRPRDADGELLPYVETEDEA